MNVPLSHHDDLRSRFSTLLGEIQSGLQTMGSLVVENLHRAGLAMAENRLDLIPVIKHADHAINEMYTQLDTSTFETIARQAPVASDLRFLVSATRMLYEIERSGDLVVNCAKMLEREDGFPDNPLLRARIADIVSAVASVFGQCVTAIADLPADAGVTLDAADDVVDDLVSVLYTEIGRQADDIGLTTAVALTRVGRFLERIADHAVNIGEHVTYIVTARFPNTDQAEGPEPM